MSCITVSSDEEVAVWGGKYLNASLPIYEILGVDSPCIGDRVGNFKIQNSLLSFILSSFIFCKVQ